MAEINISNLGGGGGGTLTLTTTGTGGASTYVAGVLNIPVYQSALTNPVTGTGTATRVAFWDSASSVSSSANLYWDNSNSFLGVGTSTPGARLQVNGTGLLTATAFAVKDSGGTDNFTVADNGATFIRGVLTISGSSASNSAALMGRTSTGEVTSVTLGTNLSFSGNTLNATGGSGSPAGSNGQVQFNSSGSFGASSNLFWNNTDIRLGVGTSSPATILNVASSTNALGYGNGAQVRWADDNSGNRPVFGFYRSRGSLTSRTSTLTGDVIGSFSFFGNGGGSNDAVGGTVRMSQNGTASSTQCPANMEFFTSDGSTEAVKLTIFPVGNIAIQRGGSFTDAGYRLDVNANSASTGAVRIRTSGSTGLNALIIQNTTPTTIFQMLDNGNTTLNGTLTLGDAKDIAVGSTTGTKIGTATTQKIGFYNKTPIVRPDTGVAEAAFVENAGGTAVNDDSTFGGYTLRQVVQALQNLGLLA